MPPETGPKIDFFRNVKRNLNEIEAQKKSEFELPTNRQRNFSQKLNKSKRRKRERKKKEKEKEIT